MYVQPSRLFLPLSEFPWVGKGQEGVFNRCESHVRGGHPNPPYGPTEIFPFKKLG